MFNKDVVAPGKMRRKIVNPRIILLDCPLEYKKGENQTNAELVKEEDWGVLLKMEEEYIQNMCMQILKFKPDLVITEKGLSDLACHYLSKAGVSAIRRLRKTKCSKQAYLECAQHPRKPTRNSLPKPRSTGVSCSRPVLATKLYVRSGTNGNRILRN